MPGALACMRRPRVAKDADAGVHRQRSRRRMRAWLFRRSGLPGTSPSSSLPSSAGGKGKDVLASVHAHGRAPVRKRISWGLRRADPAVSFLTAGHGGSSSLHGPAARSAMLFRLRLSLRWRRLPRTGGCTAGRPHLRRSEDWEKPGKRHESPREIQSTADVGRKACAPA